VQPFLRLILGRLVQLTFTHTRIASPLPPPKVSFSVFFHDAIYDAKASTPGANEIASAQLWRQFARECAAADSPPSSSCEFVAVNVPPHYSCECAVPAPPSVNARPFRSCEHGGDSGNATVGGGATCHVAEAHASAPPAPPASALSSAPASSLFTHPLSLFTPCSALFTPPSFNFTPERVDRVSAFIERTAHHLKGEAAGDLALFLDADLEVLSRSQADYSVYAQQVRLT
jgi:hypothetical protein